MNKFLLLCLFIFASCIEDNHTPESALKEMIETRMGKIVSRDEVLDQVTGPMKASVENMSDEDFNKFADLTNVEKNSFKILSKSCQEKKCFVTYSIAYKTKQEDKATFTSEVKKIAEIIFIEGKWLISDVSNIKTYHESLEPINPLE
jgi:hypothetical protein